MRILVLLNVFLKLRKRESGIGVGEGGAGVAGKKFINDFGEELMCDESRVIGVADYDASDAFSAAICVECVG